MQPELNLFYLHNEQLGYGRYGTQLAAAIRRQGVDAYERMPAAHGLYQLDEKEQRPQEPGEERICNTACWVSYPSHAGRWHRGQRPVISTMWEATRIPDAMRAPLHEFATIIVPSEQNRELFARYHPDVRVVPLGIDPAVWRYTARQPADREFRFLCCGAGERKGPDLAINAFRKAFPDGSWGSGPTPVLWLKNPRGRILDPRTGIERILESDREVMLSGRIDADDEIALYAAAHCLLAPSRGEGFGLQPLQAIAQGCPTILTAAHGHAGFAHLGWEIDATYTKAGEFMLGDAGDWWEPDLDHLATTMRDIYETYGNACELAKRSAATVAAEWTWDHTARAFLDAIGPEHLTVPYAGDGSVYVPIQERFPLTVLAACTFDIAGIAYRFEPGRTYYEPADIKRSMFTAGVLDPRCLDTAGLHPSQIADFDAHSGAHAYCPTCTQRLNTQPTRADDILAEMEAAL